MLHGRCRAFTTATATAKVNTHRCKPLNGQQCRARAYWSARAVNSLPSFDSLTECFPTDERAAKCEQRLMDLRTPLVAHFEPPKPIEPGECALHDPPIPSQSVSRLDATPRNPRSDAPSAQCLATARVVIAFIRMQFHRTSAWSPTTLARQTQRRNGVNRHFEPLGIVHIGPRDGHRQRHPVTVDHDVALRAQLPTIRRILAGLFAPPGAGTLALSSDARVQSMRPASWSHCRSV